MPEAAGRLPDVVIACVGGGSNAMGIFHPYIPHEHVKLVGVEAAGEGIDSGRHAASLIAGRPGVLHGNRTYLLQDADGQIVETHSVSAGLDYPGVGPEHAWLKDSGRAHYVGITDDEALAAFHDLLPRRGHHPGARIGARARLRVEARADAPEGQDPAGQPLGPGRQGHEHGRRALGAEVLLPPRVRSGAALSPWRPTASTPRSPACARRGAPRSFPTSRPAIRRSRRRST